MTQYSRKTVALRLKTLRESRNLTVTEMGKKLAELLGGNGLDVMTIDEKSGKHTVSQLESPNGDRNISPNLALAYAEIFDVSLDYIYGRSELMKPENKDVAGATRLSEKALKNLEKFYTQSIDFGEDDANYGAPPIDYEIFFIHTDVLNGLIEDSRFSEMTEYLYKYNICKHGLPVDLSRFQGDYTEREKWWKTLDTLRMSNFRVITNSEYADVCIDRACDLLKEIAERMRPIDEDDMREWPELNIMYDVDSYF